MAAKTLNAPILGMVIGGICMVIFPAWAWWQYHLALERGYETIRTGLAICSLLVFVWRRRVLLAPAERQG